MTSPSVFPSPSLNAYLQMTSASPSNPQIPAERCASCNSPSIKFLHGPPIGDTVSPSGKTALVIFRKHRRQVSPPPLLLQGFTINILTTYKFLGVTFHYKFSWIPHIKLSKAKCINSLNVLKYLSHPCLGCNRNCYSNSIKVSSAPNWITDLRYTTNHANPP